MDIIKDMGQEENTSDVRTSTTRENRIITSCISIDKVRIFIYRSLFARRGLRVRSENDKKKR